ncbi:MAG: hypothetical protein LC750_16720 [Actinobacteria bacterium]|nr:hypothetical protein [Actinomycetota bacterium]
MLKCNVCGGTYEPVLADGSQYFHACAPLSVVELRDALEKKTVSLRPAQQAQLDAATADDQKTPVAADQLSRVDRVLASLVVERPNKRDENIAGAGAPGQPAPVKRETLGTTKV